MEISKLLCDHKLSSLAIRFVKWKLILTWVLYPVQLLLLVIVLILGILLRLRLLHWEHSLRLILHSCWRQRALRHVYRQLWSDVPISPIYRGPKINDYPNALHSLEYWLRSSSTILFASNCKQRSRPINIMEMLISMNSFEIPIVIGWPCLDRIDEARNTSKKSAWPDNCKPPGTIFNWPIPSLKQRHGNWNIIAKKRIFESIYRCEFHHFQYP